jgi:hypothetical protein
LGETLDKAAALAPLGSAPVREKVAEMEEGRLELEERNTCWYCGGCRARSAAAVGTTNAEAFKRKHGHSCGAEITRIVRHAVEATPVTGPPCSIEGLIAEVQAARRDETLITPGLESVAEVLRTVQRMDSRLEPRRLPFPFPQFRRTDYELPRELCHASHS